MFDPTITDEVIQNLKEGELIYDGSHFYAAVKCFDAGYVENAASWMRRDIGEYDEYEPADYPDVTTIRKSGPYLVYKPIRFTQQNISGAGI